jgi:4-hydroxybenzoate polyprenyltransferase
MPNRAGALIASSHPGPTLAVTIVTVALSVSAGLEPWRVVLIGFAMLFDQLSVGLSNDWIDARRDAVVGRTDKPIAQGRISVATVRTAAIVCLALALALTVPLGIAPLLAHILAIASAWAYNARLKSTPFSALPYLLSFGLLPSIPLLAATPPTLAPWWLAGAAALLGLAAHIANVLPDLAADTATGIRGMPHRLGARASGLLLAAALAAASALLYVGVPDVLHIAGLAIGVAIASACAVLILRGNASRLLFRLIIAAAVVDVVLLVLSRTG